jgi:hypothetical protein
LTSCRPSLPHDGDFEVLDHRQRLQAPGGSSEAAGLVDRAEVLDPALRCPRYARVPWPWNPTGERLGVLNRPGRDRGFSPLGEPTTPD